MPSENQNGEDYDLQFIEDVKKRYSATKLKAKEVCKSSPTAGFTGNQKDDRNSEEGTAVRNRFPEDEGRNRSKNDSEKQDGHKSRLRHTENRRAGVQGKASVSTISEQDRDKKLIPRSPPQLKLQPRSGHKQQSANLFQAYLLSPLALSRRLSTSDSLQPHTRATKKASLLCSPRRSGLHPM